MFDRLRLKLAIRLIRVVPYILPLKAFSLCFVVDIPTGTISVSDSSACSKEEIEKIVSKLVDLDIRCRMRNLGYVDTVTEEENIIRMPGSWRVQ